MKLAYYLSIISCLLFFGVASGQNLVPNPGFELNDTLFCRGDPPVCSAQGWEHVNFLTPTITSSAIDSSCTAYNPKPFSGQHAVDIMVTGEFQQPEFHQYIQAKLLKPMVPGHLYYAEMWIRPNQIGRYRNRHYPQSYNNIGMTFSPKAVHSQNNRHYFNSPLDSISYFKLGEWTCLSGYITPSKQYDYVILGKVFNNEPSKKEKFYVKRTYPADPEGFNYFTLIDEVSIIDLTEKAELDSTLSRSIPNLEFVVNSTNLSQPYQAAAQLNKIYLTLLRFPELNITITGHTDSEGTEEYNQELSEARANKAKSYFVGRGIAADRITAKGKGESEPLAKGTSDADRQDNRRIAVELVVSSE